MDTYQDFETSKTFTGVAFSKHTYNFNDNPADNNRAGQYVIIFARKIGAVDLLDENQRSYAVIHFYKGRCRVRPFQFQYQAEYVLAANCQAASVRIAELGDFNRRVDVQMYPDTIRRQMQANRATLRLR